MDGVLEFLEFALLTSVGIAVYFAPALIAHKRKPLAAFTIYNVKLCLGWTVIGWFYAFYLSLRSPTEGED